MNYINSEIEQLLQIVDNPLTIRGNHMFNRLQAWSVLSLFNDVIIHLVALSEQLDLSLNTDALSIDFDKYLNLVLAKRDKLGLIARNSLFSGLSTGNCNKHINYMSDCLPNGDANYGVTSDVVGSFRTAMHQLCDEERINSRIMECTLQNALDKIYSLLNEIKTKVEKPEPYLYTKLWDTIEYNSRTSKIEECYRKWVDDNAPDFNELKGRQNQEIYELLKSGFFRFCPKPTGGAVKKRKLKLGEDDLEVGTDLFDGLEVECTRFEKFFEWKGGNILVLNYEKLGKYIYNNYSKFEPSDFVDITYFDAIMELIHEDMAKIKPGLAQFLKRYQEHQDEELLKDCIKIFEPFKDYLKEDLSPTLIDEYLKQMLFESDVKEEAKKKLNGQSKNKYCCSIVLALSFCNIFKPEYNNSNKELASALCKGLDLNNKGLLYDYLRNAKNNNRALTTWTASVIDELKKAHFLESKGV